MDRVYLHFLAALPHRINDKVQLTGLAIAGFFIYTDKKYIQLFRFYNQSL